MKNLKTQLSNFNTSITELKQALREDKEIEQNHFGDFLMIEEKEGDEKYRVWLNHNENVKLGSPIVQIEYFGKQNGYVWGTISEINF